MDGLAASIRKFMMSNIYSPTLLKTSPAIFFNPKKAVALAICTLVIGITGCTAAMQQKADQSYLSLKKSLIESIKGKQAKSIAIPADALIAKPASLDQLLLKVGRLAAQDDRAVEITSMDNDRNYLRRGVASGALESGKVIKITMLHTGDRANTLIILK